MSITRSISVVQTNDWVLKAGSPRDKQSDRYTRKEREYYVDHSYDYASLFKRTYEASDVHEIEDDNMSITCSISVVQTDNRVLKAGSSRDKQSDRYT